MTSKSLAEVDKIGIIFLIYGRFRYPEYLVVET